MITTVKDVFTESAGLPTTAPAKSVGKVPTVTSAYPCLDATTELAATLSNVTARTVGRGPTATSRAAATAPTGTASDPTSASATTAGRGTTAMSANQWQAAYMELASIILTPASVNLAGKDTCVTSHLVTSIAITDSAMLQATEHKTSASANLVGGERAATSADHTGCARTRIKMLAPIRMNASATASWSIPKVSATTQS